MHGHIHKKNSYKKHIHQTQNSQNIQIISIVLKMASKQAITGHGNRFERIKVVERKVLHRIFHELINVK